LGYPDFFLTSSNGEWQLNFHDHSAVLYAFDRPKLHKEVVSYKFACLKKTQGEADLDALLSGGRNMGK